MSKSRVFVSMLDLVSCALGGIILMWILTVDPRSQSGTDGKNTIIRLFYEHGDVTGSLKKLPQFSTCLHVSGESVLPEDSPRTIGAFFVAILPATLNAPSETIYTVTVIGRGFAEEDRLVVFLTDLCGNSSPPAGVQLICEVVRNTVDPPTRINLPISSERAAVSLSLEELTDAKFEGDPAIRTEE